MDDSISNTEFINTNMINNTSLKFYQSVENK